jgi:hypothetical protein
LEASKQVREGRCGPPPRGSGWRLAAAAAIGLAAAGVTFGQGAVP